MFHCVSVLLGVLFFSSTSSTNMPAISSHKHDWLRNVEIMQFVLKLPEQESLLFTFYKMWTIFSLSISHPENKFYNFFFFSFSPSFPNKNKHAAISNSDYRIWRFPQYTEIIQGPVARLRHGNADFLALCFDKNFQGPISQQVLSLQDTRWKLDLMHNQGPMSEAFRKLLQPVEEHRGERAPGYLPSQHTPPL